MTQQETEDFLLTLSYNIEQIDKKIDDTIIRMNVLANEFEWLIGLFREKPEATLEEEG